MRHVLDAPECLDFTPRLHIQQPLHRRYCCSVVGYREGETMLVIWRSGTYIVYAGSVCVRRPNNRSHSCLFLHLQGPRWGEGGWYGGVGLYPGND